MREVIHRDKNGKVIPDISKVKISYDLSVSIFKILNPGLTVEPEKKPWLSENQTEKAV